jgi:hypothetical protein
VKSVPRALRHRFFVLDRLLSLAEREEVRQSREDDLFEYHFSLGTFVRNRFIFSRPKSALAKLARRATHDDTVSSIVLRCYRRHLRGEALQFGEQMNYASLCSPFPGFGSSGSIW